VNVTLWKTINKQRGRSGRLTQFTSRCLIELLRIILIVECSASKAQIVLLGGVRHALKLSLWETQAHKNAGVVDISVTVWF
jgi:hypothetical protein